MSRSAIIYWTYLQAMAWVRWRQPGIDRYFKDESSPARWKACVIHPTMAISAWGLPNATYEVVCPNPQAQLDHAVREGQIHARAVDGLDMRMIDPAVWHSLVLDKKSMAFRQGERMAINVLFDAAEMMKQWSSASPAMIQRAGTEVEGFAWLKSKMAEGPKKKGVTKDSLLVESRIGLGPRAWARAYKDAAKEADPSWRKPGPARA